MIAVRYRFVVLHYHSHRDQTRHVPYTIPSAQCGWKFIDEQCMAFNSNTNLLGIVINTPIRFYSSECVVKMERSA
jgi:hypothetical protein